jgi:ABC-2 type transport system permease protein
MSWSIAWKDIQDALKNKNTRINILLMLAYVVFFYWLSTPRPFDKEIEVVVYDQGSISQELNSVYLEDGSSLVFMPVHSLEEMERTMPYRELGLILPPDFEQKLESEAELTLEGFILWVYRNRVEELEERFSEKFTEWLDQPVNIQIGNNFVITPYDIPPSTTHQTVLFVVLLLALTIVPHLMLEEKRTKTMEALLVSPASVSQVVLGKAIAGLFYVLLGGVIAFILNRMYVVNWGMVVLGFFSTAFFAITLALVVATFAKSTRSLALWLWPIIIVLLVPAFFAEETFLTPVLKSIFTWLPTTAMSKLIRFSFTNSVPISLIATNLAVVLISSSLLFGVVVWKVRLSDS